MNKLSAALGLAAALAGGALAVQAQPQSPHPMASGGPMHHPASHRRSDQTLIASAMSAAPPAVGRTATIIDVSPGGAVRVVRKGSSGFTCMADDPVTPGPDPMCLDANAMEWAQAWMGHKPPPRKAGFMYMLAGGTDASNTDPYAKAPSQSNHWIKTGPHVMMVGDPEILRGYPSSADPDTRAPYVMWAGTPYAHLMLPVR